jgi:hypothetical protein
MESHGKMSCNSPHVVMIMLNSGARVKVKWGRLKGNSRVKYAAFHHLIQSI